jgi:hypothetical protein
MNTMRETLGDQEMIWGFYEGATRMTTMNKQSNRCRNFD